MKWCVFLGLVSCRTVVGSGVEDYGSALKARDPEEARRLFERAWRPLLEEAEDEDDPSDELAARSMAIRCFLETGRDESAEYHIRRGASIFATVPLDRGDPVGLLLIRAERAKTVEDKLVEVALAASRLGPGPALRYVQLRQVRLLIEQSKSVGESKARASLESAMQICRFWLDEDFRAELKIIDGLLSGGPPGNHREH